MTDWMTHFNGIKEKVGKLNRFRIYAVSFLCAFGATLLIYLLRNNDLKYLYEETASGWYGILRSLGNNPSLSAFSDENALSFLSFAVNPINRFYALFSLSSATFGVVIINAIRNGIASSVFSLWLKKCNVSDLTASMFGILYALSSYSMLTQFGFASPDSVVILPLLLLGIDNLNRRRGISLFAFSLAFAILTSYNTSFGLFVFSFLAFLCFFFSDRGPSPRNVKAFIVSFVLFAFSSLLGLVASASILIPAVRNLTVSFKDLAFTQKFNLIDFFAKMLPGAYDGLLENNLPYLYMGMAPLLLLPVYYLNPAVSKRNKVCSACLTFVLYFTFSVQVLSRFWDLFSKDVTVRYSLAILFPALFLTISAESMDKLEKNCEKAVTATAGALITLVAILQKINLTYTKEGTGTETPVKVSYFNSIECVWVPIFFLILGTASLLLVIRQKENDKPKTRKARVFLASAPLLITVFDVGVSNAALVKIAAKSESTSMGSSIGNNQYAVSYYDAYSSGFSAFENELKFYRAEKADRYSDNDLLYLGIDSLSDFDPAFLSSLGINVDKNGLIESVVSPLTLSLLGVRYFATREKLETYPTTALKLKKETDKTPTYDTPGLFPESLSDLFDIVYQSDLTTIYENKFVLPTVFSAAGVPNGDVLSDTLLSPYSRINSIFQTLTGDSTASPYRISNIVSVIPTYCKISETTSVPGYTVYESKLTNGNPYIVFNVQVTDDGPLYCSFGGEYGREVSAVKVNGKEIGYAYSIQSSSEESETDTDKVVPNSFLLGTFTAGETVTVTLTFGNTTDNQFVILPEGQAFFYEIDQEETERIVKFLSNGISELKDGNYGITGKLTDSVSLPYVVATLSKETASVTSSESVPFLGLFTAGRLSENATSFSISPVLSSQSSFLISCAGILLIFLFLLLEKLFDDGYNIPFFSRFLKREEKP